MKRTLFSLLGAALAVGAGAAVLLMERRRPLRPGHSEPPLRRQTRNLAVAGLGAATLHWCEQPVVQPLARMVERRRWGLLPALRLPVWVERTLAVLLLDYTLYVWHILTHRVPFLWRFHLVHHVDLELDASTALRFHAGELVCSTAWRAAQVVLIGVSPAALSLWSTLLLCSIVFHHANLRLPLPVERLLQWVVMTPRLHSIHHTAHEADTNANWSSGLIWWDRLHGTFRGESTQPGGAIGVPAYRSPEELHLPDLLALPFTGQRTPFAPPPGEHHPDR